MRKSRCAASPSGGILSLRQRHTPRPEKSKIPLSPVSGGSKTNGKSSCPCAAARPRALTAALSCPEHTGKGTPMGRKNEKSNEKTASRPHGGAVVSRSLARGTGCPWSGKASQRPPGGPCAPYGVGGCLSPCPENRTRERAGTAIPAARPFRGS